MIPMKDCQYNEEHPKIPDHHVRSGRLGELLAPLGLSNLRAGLLPGSPVVPFTHFCIFGFSVS